MLHTTSMAKVVPGLPSIGLLLSALFALAGPARADAPYEQHDTPVAQIAAAVLEDAIGVLTLSRYATDGETNLARLPTLRRVGDAWEDDLPVDFACVRSVSHCGYSDFEAIDLRLPIVAVRGERVQIAWDPVADRRAWIEPAAIDSQWAFVELFEPIGATDDIGALIDPFFFFEPGVGRRVYRRPAADALSFTIWAGTRGELQVLERRGDWLLLGEVTYDGPLGPLGWIRLRDDRGRLSVWLACIVGC